MSNVPSTTVLLDDRFALPSQPLYTGGHARLYKAYDLKAGKEVALKVFSPASRVDDRVLALAWTNELDLYDRLGAHPNLLELVAYGAPHEGTPWIAFEWCGQDLQSHVEDSVPSWDLFSPIAMEILSGLGALHAKGFVHRDVKPKNILIDQERIKVADFGTVRLREVTSLGMTMQQLGTPPYAPPELGTFTPTPAGDIYSYAVLVIACMSGDFDMVGTTPQSVMAGLALPGPVADILTRCLSDDAEDRPGSAAVLLAEFRQLRSDENPDFVDVGLEITAGALEAYQSSTGAESADLNDLIREFGTRSRVTLDPRQKTDHDVLILGRTVIAIAVAHSTRPGFMVVKHVWRPWVAQMQRLRKHSTTFAVRWRPALMTTQPASTFIEDLPRILAADAAAIAVSRSSRSEVHDRWERVLDAKMDLARDRTSDISYTSFRVEGSRLFLSIGSDAVEPELEQLRVIRTTSGRYVRGEIESIVDGELILYVSEGSLAEIPRRGTVSIDAERTLSKLQREQAALRRVFEGGAARPDLKDILNNLSLNPAPDPAPIDSLFQADLDAAKHAALESVVGASGISVVQGPPGTGKTTLIAEIVAQELKNNPGSRILLASQTHIALDHALKKVTTVAPRASILRIGNPEQFGQEIEPWSIPAQLESWREETRMASAAYVARHLENNSTGDIDTRVLANRYEALVERLQRVVQRHSEQSQDLGQLSLRRDTLVEQVDLLLSAVADLDDKAPADVEEVSRAIARLVDRSLEVGQKLSDSAPLSVS